MFAGITFADYRNTDANGFVEFPMRVLHNRAAFGLDADLPSAHILVCWEGEYGDAFLDKEHPKPMSQMKLKKGSCPYG